MVTLLAAAALVSPQQAKTIDYSTTAKRLDLVIEEIATATGEELMAGADDIVTRESLPQALQERIAAVKRRLESSPLRKYLQRQFQNPGQEPVPPVGLAG